MIVVIIVVVVEPKAKRNGVVVGAIRIVLVMETGLC